MKRSKFQPGDLVRFKGKKPVRIIDVLWARERNTFAYQIPNFNYAVAEKTLRLCKSCKVPVQNTGRFRMTIWRISLADKKWVLNKMCNCLLDISEDAMCSIGTRQFAAWEADIIRRRLLKLSQAHYK
jgi:hypothetical protein